MPIFTNQLSFFKDNGKVARVWEIEDKQLKFLVARNIMKVKIVKDGVEHSIPAYNIKGIPEGVLGNPNKYLAPFLANCYAKICELNDGYAVSVLPRMLGGANIIENKNLLWPDGIVPYVLGNDIHPDYKANVRAVIRYWNDETDFQFVDYDPNRHSDYLVIGEADSVCYSYVGRQGGRQTIRCDLDDRDTTGIKFDTGSLIHELGHAVGLYHEQSRFDRNNFVHVIARNAQYTKQGTPHGKYDFSSIMHYPLQTGVMELKLNAIDSPEASPPAGRDPSNIGQRRGLSRGDIAAANYLVERSRSALVRRSDQLQLVRPQQDYQQAPCCTLQ